MGTAQGAVFPLLASDLPYATARLTYQKGLTMKNFFTRRRFLATAAATAGASLVGKSLFNVDKVLAGGPVVRLNVAGLTLASSTITSYINGITAMKALSSADPRSWSYQAAIHGSMMMGMPDWNTCQHGNNFFWSWHRMYLYWFERIVRSQAGDPTWALPYWNWQAHPKLPSMFQNPPIGSPALVSPRNANINNGTVGVGNQTPGVNNANATPIFEGAAGAVQLMQIPHNNVHVNVGGLMGSIQTAAEDPIFFLHHANVDRLWDLWLTKGPLQSDPTTDAAWGSQVFGFFDELGNPQMMTSCDVLRAAMQLNYTYQGEPAQVNQFCGDAEHCTSSSKILLENCIPRPPFSLKPGTLRTHFVFTVSSTLAQEILRFLENSANTIYLEYFGVTAPTQPGAVWDTYVGLPLTSPPSQSSPYYVGSYGMYGAGIADQPPDGNEPANFSFPINTAIATALKNSRTIPVTFITTTTKGTTQAAAMTIQQAQMTVQTVTASGNARSQTVGEKVIARLAAHH